MARPTAGELRALHYAIPDHIADDEEVFGHEQYSHGPMPETFYAHVDKSNDPKPPTAGELRAFGYLLDATLPDEAVFTKDFMSYASGGPTAPGVYHPVDDPARPHPPVFPYPLPKAEPAAEPVAEEPEMVETAEEPLEANDPETAGRLAAQAGMARSSNPYDVRRAAGRAWNRGFDSAERSPSPTGSTQPTKATKAEPKARTAAERRRAAYEEMEQVRDRTLRSI